MEQDLAQRLLSGDRRALSRLITLVERHDARVPELLQSLHHRTGRAYRIGVTGPPGSGKSTLVDSLVVNLRQQQRSVGILAVDPTSPYTGGAVLGDRIRMQRHYLDRDVFIRSMATRGSLGGVAKTLRWAAQVLDAAGKDVVLVETVGIGQADVDVTNVADTVVVVLVPESGDAIQVMKAGLMEIADIFVVNKADREGAQEVVAALKAMLSMGEQVTDWMVPVIATQANAGIGVADLHASIQGHREFLESSSQLEVRRRRQRRQAFLQSVEDALHARLSRLLQETGKLAEVAQAVERGEEDPLAAAHHLLNSGALSHLFQPPPPE
ncbi:MAG: methylmalonyl Co-A mutase-associated GTPase MeaB [Dehalococcoidia bacterium]